MIGRTNSMTVMPQSMLRSFCALKEKRTAKHTNEWGKSDVQDWKNEVWGRLEEADKSESLSDLILERIKELVDNSTEKVPDFIYSSAIQLLLSKNLTAEAFTVLIQVRE